MTKYKLIDHGVTDVWGRLQKPREVLNGKLFDTKKEALDTAQSFWGSMDGIELLEIEYKND